MQKKKKSKVGLWIVLALIAAGLIGGYFYAKTLQPGTEQAQGKTAAATRGTVTRTITGSGRLAAADTESIDAESNLEVAAISVRTGDKVATGDVLLTYRTDSITDRIDALYTEIASLDREIMRRQTADSITAPTSGRIKALYVEPGGSLDSAMRTYGALALLSSDEKMQVIIETDAELAIGKNVTVTYEGGRQTGTVANVTEGGYLITLPDNNVPMDVTAEVFDRDTKLGEGTLSIHAPVQVFGNGGTVQTVHVSVNGTVWVGAKLFTLADQPSSASYADALQQREDKAKEIADLYELLKDPTLTAPVDGTVAEIRAAEGSTVNGEAFVLHTGGATRMTVAVDELDVGVVSIGQSAVITLDAFAGETFDAEVTHLSRLGTPSGSITTYDVELTLAFDERLLEGMNGSATIIAQQKDDALLIPVAAIFEDESGVYVYVQTAGEPERREIVTGLSDGMNAEIVSGLAEGEIVQYQDTYVGLVDRYNQQYGRMGGGN